jgi:N-acyl-D-amino-acid deacylase
MKEIHRLINDAMDAGAIGISMSAMGEHGNSHVDWDGSPMPTDVAEHDVILDICSALVDRGEGVIQLLSHLIIYGDRSLTERVLKLAKGSGVSVIHNSFMTSDLMPGMMEKDLAWLEEQRRKGYDVTANALMSRTWIEAGMRQLDVSCGMLASVRKIVECKSDDDLLILLGNADYQRAFALEYATKGPTNGANGMEGQIVISVGDDPELAGYLDRTLGDIAKEEDRNVVEVMLDLARRSKLALQLRSPQISSTDPRQAARMLSHGAIVHGGSDGGAHTKSFGMGHVATDLMIWLVREEKLMGLEDIHFHLALKPARAVKISDRGALLKGFWADILIYDLDTLYVDTKRFEIVHDMPNGDWRRRGRAGGYDYILVNGVVTHERDVPSGATPGQLVRICSDRRELLPVAAA